MKYQLLQTILPYLETYERLNPKSDDVRHFAAWLMRQTAEMEEGNGEYEPKYPGDTPEVAISRLVVFMNRYAKVYGKKALEGSVLGNTDEFVYLASLHHAGPMSKTDLIHRNRHEKPTGMDIIKRLLALELITQKDDPADRRGKVLTISLAGIEVVTKLYNRMGIVSHLVAGNLSKPERLQLLHLLEKLEQFHQFVQVKSKNDTLENTARVVRDAIVDL